MCYMTSYIILPLFVHCKEIWRGSQFRKIFIIQLLTAPPLFSLLVPNTFTSNPFSNFSVQMFHVCEEQTFQTQVKQQAKLLHLWMYCDFCTCRLKESNTGDCEWKVKIKLYLIMLFRNALSSSNLRVQKCIFYRYIVFLHSGKPPWTFVSSEFTARLTSLLATNRGSVYLCFVIYPF